jgi:esterase/lipase
MPKFIRIIFAKILGFYINLLSYIRPNKSLSVAYQFFSEPQQGRLKLENLPAILKEATSEMITSNNHSFQTYTWKGNDNKILLIHGWESNAARWEKLLKFLKKSGSTIIAIDAPAHGLSSGKEFSVPVYASFIHSISQLHQPQFIIGHSMGGVASIYYQYHYDQKHIEKMVLLGSPSDFRVILQNYINTLSLNKKVHQLMIDYIIERFNIVIDEFTGEHFLKSTQIQGIIAHDVHDSVVSFNEAKKLASSWKTAQFIETKGLGHSLHDEKLYHNIYEFLFQ